MSQRVSKSGVLRTSACYGRSVSPAFRPTLLARTRQQAGASAEEPTARIAEGARKNACVGRADCVVPYIHSSSLHPAIWRSSKRRRPLTRQHFFAQQQNPQMGTPVRAALRGLGALGPRASALADFLSSSRKVNARVGPVFLNRRTGQLAPGGFRIPPDPRRQTY